MNEDKRIYSVLLALTATFWSLGGLLIKLINWNPIAIAGTRSLIAATLLFIYLKKPKLSMSRAQIAAALSYVATVFLFVSATKITTAANAIFLQFTAPIYVALFSTKFLNEKITIRDWLTTIIVIMGMVLFFFDNFNLEGIIGNTLGVASGISFASFTIFMRMQKNSSPIESVFLGNIITAIIALPFMFQDIPGTISWLFLIVLGIFQLGIPYIFYSIAIKNVSAIDAVLIPVLEPILNPIWVFLLLGEYPGIWTIIGGSIIITTITLRYLLPLINFNAKNLSKQEAKKY